jgi:hypothetical protein
MSVVERLFREMTDFFQEIGAADLRHTHKTYLAHGISVYTDLKKWGCDEELCRVGMFHSIYGTEKFQSFTLPLERRAEIRALIGDRAERLSYLNCAVLRASIEPNLASHDGPFTIDDRITGQSVELSREDFNDLVRVHLCDWLEQVPRSAEWDYRRDAYRQMAEWLGGAALVSFDEVYAGH